MLITIKEISYILLISFIAASIQVNHHASHNVLYQIIFSLPFLVPWSLIIPQDNNYIC